MMPIACFNISRCLRAMSRSAHLIMHVARDVSSSALITVGRPAVRVGLAVVRDAGGSKGALVPVVTADAA